MYTTEPTTKMLRSEKNFLLSQVSSVLSELQCLVSNLMSVKCEDEEDVSYSSDEEESSSVKNMSWDYDHDFPVYSTTPSAFYSLVFPESSDEESDPVPMNDCLRKSVIKECSFVNNLKDFISSNYPDFVYNQEKSSQIRKEQLNAKVCEELHCMWDNVGDLFIQKPDSEENCTTSPPVPTIRYKSIDFAKVNVRSMANIPKPTSFPIHGCSQEPKFYTEIVKLDYVDYYGNRRTLPCSYSKKNPFGSMYGYQTNDGIVPVPDTPVHGHVWSDQLHDWVLHAVFPEECSPARAPWGGSRFPTTRRPPSTRRGWSTSRPRREGKG